MNEQHYIIDIDEQRMPYNTYMVLPLDVLTKIASVISTEILKGLVDDNGIGIGNVKTTFDYSG